MEQQTEHGGSLGLGKRRVRRTLTIHEPIHIVLRSDFAYGDRSLLKHRLLINKIIARSAKKFAIKVYEYAIVTNHIHLLIMGRKRRQLQNFFRVVAGHLAQELLRRVPLKINEKNIQEKAARKHRETDNKFWQTRIYTQLVKWGREFFRVKAYIIQNTKEALGLIPYRPRKAKNTS